MVWEVEVGRRNDEQLWYVEVLQLPIEDTKEKVTDMIQRLNISFSGLGHLQVFRKFELLGGPL